MHAAREGRLPRAKVGYQNESTHAQSPPWQLMDASFHIPAGRGDGQVPDTLLTCKLPSPAYLFLGQPVDDALEIGWKGLTKRVQTVAADQCVWA